MTPPETRGPVAVFRQVGAHDRSTGSAEVMLCSAWEGVTYAWEGVGNGLGNG